MIFEDLFTLVDSLLDRRRTIAEAIECRMLNVRGKDTSRRRDRPYFERLLQSCLFDSSDPDSEQMKTLPRELADAHRRDGFERMAIDAFTHELDPLELTVRAYEYWDATRWPGANGRLALARTLLAAFIIRQLELLSLRISDDGPAAADTRLDAIQQRLDRLNDDATVPVFLRDAAWLIQTAQGPLTKSLPPYFAVAANIASSITGDRRLHVHAAGAKLAGGHLRSQLRYRVWNSRRTVDDRELVAFNRNSNSMDLALLVYDLLPLLEAYQSALATADGTARVRLADAILQGLSADPDLLIARHDLLAPYTFIEDLFIEIGHDQRPRYASLGEAHRALLSRYRELIAELAHDLCTDAARFEPAQHVYSPYGVVYGFCADVLSNIAAAVLAGQPSFRLSLDDMLNGGGDTGHKLAQASSWARLPKRPGERDHFDHSIEWGRTMFRRVVEALERRASAGNRLNASSRQTGRLVIGDPGDASAGTNAREYCVTSDLDQAASGATPQPVRQVQDDRNEARFLGSGTFNGHWFGVSKLVLTMFSDAGTDAVLGPVPTAVEQVLRLSCEGLIVDSGTRNLYI